MSSARPSPRRPLDRLVAARRAAAGLGPEAVARAAGRPPDEVRALWCRPEFRELVDGWADLMARPPEAREARLVELAYAVLEDGLAAGDPRVAAFVVREALRRRKAAETLARGVGRSIARDLAHAAADAADAPAAEPDGHAAPPVDPSDRLCRRGAAHLRRRLIEEHMLGWRAARAAPAEPLPEPPTRADAPPALGPALAAAAALPDDAGPTAAPDTLPTPPLAARLLGRLTAGLPATALARRRVAARPPAGGAMPEGP